MEKEKIERINELARKSKLEPLSPEELAEGMRDVITLNGTVERRHLFMLIASLCGHTRLSPQDVAALDGALAHLAEYVCIDGDNISLK